MILTNHNSTPGAEGGPKVLASSAYSWVVEAICPQAPESPALTGKASSLATLYLAGTGASIWNGAGNVWHAGL